MLGWYLEKKHSGMETLLARFPAPAVAFCGVLVMNHVILRIGGIHISDRLFLQPAYTVYHPHELVTAGIFEDSTPNLALTVLALLYWGKLLQPAWGDRECARFLLLVNVLQVCGSWLCMIILYVLFREEGFLFARLGGCTGLLGGLSVAVKQQVVRGAEPALPPLMAALLPHIVVVQLCWSVAMLSLLHVGPMHELLFAFNGVVVAWTYLRFYQPRHSGVTGDASAGFAFASLFPVPAQPPLRVLGNVCFGIASSCGCFPPLGWDTPLVVQSWPPQGAVRPSELPVEPAPPPPTVTTDDPEVAERRRARARALLEERLQKATASSAPGDSPAPE